MSVAGPTRARFPLACSGAMYPGVPTRKPLCVIVWPPPIVWARPKSVIFGWRVEGGGFLRVGGGGKRPGAFFFPLPPPPSTLHPVGGGQRRFPSALRRPESIRLMRSVWARRGVALA